MGVCCSYPDSLRDLDKESRRYGRRKMLDPTTLVELERRFQSNPDLQTVEKNLHTQVKTLVPPTGKR
jgi:hypothetical protein